MWTRSRQSSERSHIRDGLWQCVCVLWLALRTLAAFVWEWVKPMPRLAPQGTRKASQSGRFYGYGGTFLYRRVRPSTKASTAEPFEWDTLYR